jgi:hypothetical protein
MMCSTCNYKNFEVVEHKINDKVERKLEQKLGIAEKLIFAGKIIIFITSLPIFYAVFNLLVGLVQ